MGWSFMSEVQSETKKDNGMVPYNYSCEILLEKTTLDKCNDRTFPSDGYIVKYKDDEGNDCIDLTRCAKMTGVFDMYYDRYKNVESIDYGMGQRNPKMWGYKPPERKKKK